MNPEEEQHLADLLQQATDNVTIVNRYTKERANAKWLQATLIKQWNRFVPRINVYHPESYIITVQNHGVYQQLLDAVAGALHDHTYEERVQTATTSIVGGMYPGYSIEDLAERLIRVAIAKGPQLAAQTFYRDIHDQVATYRWVGLLNGIRLEESIEVRPGINMIPLPRDSRELPPIFQEAIDFDPKNLMGMTIIVVDLTVAPIYAAPGPESPIMHKLFQHEQKCKDLPDFSMEKFCYALALACDGPVELFADWHVIDPSEIFLAYMQHVGGQRIYHDGRRSRSNVPAIAEQVGEAVLIYQSLNDFDEKILPRLEVPIKRWVKSKTQQSLVDSFIDLGITLESLYLDRRTEELGFRLRLRVALFLKESTEERQALVNDVRKIYGCRSQAVHQGVLKRNQANLDCLTNAQYICRQSIVKVIQYTRETGELPDWDRMELGQLNEGSSIESS